MQVCCCRTACPNLICWYVVVELESLLVALDCYRILLATVPPVGYPHTRLAHLTPLYNRHSKLGCCKEDYSSIPTDPDYGLVVVHVHPWRAGAQLWRRQWPRRPARYSNIRKQYLFQLFFLITVVLSFPNVLKKKNNLMKNNQR